MALEAAHARRLSITSAGQWRNLCDAAITSILSTKKTVGGPFIARAIASRLMSVKTPLLLGDFSADPYLKTAKEG